MVEGQERKVPAGFCPKDDLQMPALWRVAESSQNKNYCPITENYFCTLSTKNTHNFFTFNPIKNMEL